jgi:hypothetical protein
MATDGSLQQRTAQDLADHRQMINELSALQTDLVRVSFLRMTLICRHPSIPLFIASRPISRAQLQANKDNVPALIPVRSFSDSDLYK